MGKQPKVAYVVLRGRTPGVYFTWSVSNTQAGDVLANELLGRRRKNRQMASRIVNLKVSRVQTVGKRRRKPSISAISKSRGIPSISLNQKASRTLAVVLRVESMQEKQDILTVYRAKQQQERYPLYTNTYDLDERGGIRNQRRMRHRSRASGL